MPVVSAAVSMVRVQTERETETETERDTHTHTRTRTHTRTHTLSLSRRFVHLQDYWRLDKVGRLPVKHMAVESLTQKRFYVASDVWAFG